jgi:hypothetical protein
MKKAMFWLQRISFTGFSVVLIFSTLALIASENGKIRSATKNISHNPAKGIVILELFTSQGCSSCPPADALLAEYANAHDENIIPLSFHVDYWNRLGWTDPFSSNVYSARQQWYSQHLPRGSIYTPQLVVNGKAEAVGNNRNAVNGLVQKALAGKSTEIVSVDGITVDNGTIRFRYQTENTGNEDVLNIALVQKMATTHIGAGENDGVTITNHNIVRAFNTQRADKEGTAQINLPASFKNSAYALVVYLQNKTNLSINAAIIKDL